MALSRRGGARSGRGWDAVPPRSRSKRVDQESDTSRDDGSSPPEESAEKKPSPPRDPYEQAREICLRQLAVRPRTRAELAQALKKRDVADEVAGVVLDRYDEVGMIDDAAFARAWVTSRHHGRGLASRALAQELRRKGVEAEVAAEALAELDPDTEAGTALELAVKKLRTMRGEPDAVFRRLVGMLARKGYSGGVAVRAVKEALAARSADDAELAELIDPDTFDESGI
jgi:regulatory protein